MLRVHHRGGRGLAEALPLLDERGADRRRPPARQRRSLVDRANAALRDRGEIDDRGCRRTSALHVAADARARTTRAIWRLSAAPSAAAAVVALVAQFGGVPRLQPLVGLIVIMTIAYALSTNRRAIDRRTVAWGLGLQILFALLVLKTDRRPARVPDARRRINRLLDFAFVGSSFVFGPLGDKVVWPRIMTHGARAGGRAVRRRVRVPGAADDHLHRRAVRHPLLLRHHAAGRARLRGRDAPGDARVAAPSR